ncbi:MAG: hypothetical protein RIQ53_3293 [Pseudomonadota bacterium]|jgi:hypothetical protein
MDPTYPDDINEPAGMVVIGVDDADTDAYDAAFDEAQAEIGAGPEPEQPITADEQRVQDPMIQALGLYLLQEFAQRKTDRMQIEERWREDLRAYRGEYDPGFLASLREARPSASQLYVPLTRRVCTLVEARWADLLFPTDDRNFVVQPSPRQEMEQAVAMAQRLGPGQTVQVPGQALTLTSEAVLQALREAQEDAAAKAAAMQKTIDDNLKECNYPAQARRAMRDALQLGSGVLKGPMVMGKVKRVYTINPDGSATMQRVEEHKPAVVRVDPWNYYPDLSVGPGEIERMSGHYEMHRMNKAQLAKLARVPGFSEAAIRTVIAMGAVQLSTADPNAESRDAAGVGGVLPSTHNLIEYNGPVDHEQLRAWGATDIPEDSLGVSNACVFFSETGGIVVKVAVWPMDTDDSPYSVLTWIEDPTCVFGYGLPFEMRDTQVGANSAIRALMDNMGLSSGPQIVVNRKKVRPVNGQMTIEPHKLWELTEGTDDVKNVFGFFQVTSLAKELLAIFGQFKAMAEEIGGPAMALQGAEAPSYMQAGATGVALAFNAASVWMRRAVRAFDDLVTVPMIGRFVDWHMQNTPDPSIKGDLSAVARGTSALLEADGYAARVQLLTKMSAEAGVPVRRIVAQLRKIATALRLDPDEMLPNDAEVQQMEEERKKAGEQVSPEVQRIQLRKAEIEDNAQQREHELVIERMRSETRIAELAATKDITIEEARVRYGIQAAQAAADIQDRRDQRKHEAQKFNAELSMKAAAGSGI